MRKTASSVSERLRTLRTVEASTRARPPGPRTWVESSSNSNSTVPEWTK